MGFFIDADGVYYTGDRRKDDLEVPERVSPTDVWSGSAWVPGPPVVPVKVTMRQARLALLQAGLLASVDASIDTMASPQKETARIEWEYSQTVERHRELVAILGPALGLNDAQVDELFITAATL